jgi:hypothetical protein
MFIKMPILAAFAPCCPSAGAGVGRLSPSAVLGALTAKCPDKPRLAGGVKGHNVDDISLPGSGALWAESFILSKGKPRQLVLSAVEGLCWGVEGLTCSHIFKYTFVCFVSPH